MNKYFQLLKNNKYFKTCLVFFTGIFLGMILFYFFGNSKIINTPNREFGHYSYINPLLECDSSGSISTELKLFKDQLIDKISTITKGDNKDFVSVYFRDMNNGPWFGINEKEAFSPASLLKVPVMMSYFKVAELNPDILSKTIKFEKKINERVSYYQLDTIKLGKTYTVEQLIDSMIINSDNDALDLLTSNALSNQVNLDDVYKYLSVNFSADGTMISVKQYSTFFRILFNASYLNQEYSEKALGLLDKVNFSYGLKAELPTNVKISHKFGERWSLTDTSKQLHDCGIVYYPDHPYLLCIMTRGIDFDKMSSIIADISKFVYDNVNKQLK